MPEPSTLTGNYQPSIHHPRPRRTRGLAVGCALVVVVGLCVISYRVIAKSRYKVDGITDPKTGYRIEFTVSSRYRMSRQAAIPEIEELETLTFRPNSPPKIVRWVRSHILKAPAPKASPSWVDQMQGCIEQFTINGSIGRRFNIDKHGYPDLDRMMGSSEGAVDRHLIISGCPAIWRANSFPYGRTNRKFQNLMVIKPNNQPVVYFFHDLDDGDNPTGAEDELMKIRDSIRITKVK
jgi:hypothetical protein